MNRSPGRLFVLAGIGVSLLAVVVAAVVELGSGPTPTAIQIRGLHRDLLLVAVPIAVMVEAALVYAVWRFRDNDDPKPTPENRALELTWTAVTALVLVFVGVASYHVLAQPAVTAAADPGAGAEDAVQVEMTAHQWYWSVEYPRENVSVERADRIVLPANRTVRFTVLSADVIHSLHVPALGLKQDAIPGHRNVVATRITRPGEYRLYCAEYCGQGHSTMEATVWVVPESQYEDWLARQGNASASSGANATSPA